MSDNLPAKTHHGKPGRPPAITKDMLPKIEELASLGLSDATIAAALQVHPDTFRAHKNGEENSGVYLAIQKGRLAAIESTADQIAQHAKKNPIAAIYRAKAILGRHDSAWQDQKHGGGSAQVKVTVEVRESVGPQSGEPAIEAEFSPVETQAETD